MAKKFDAKAKAKRQKIIAAVLGVLLLGVLAYEVPSLMKTMNKKPPANNPVAAPATPAPAGTPVAGAPTPAGTPVSATTLTDSDPSAQPGAGQLLSFDRFTSKDPFAQQASTSKASSAPTKPAAPRPPPPPPPPPPAPKSFGITSAHISVNGNTEQVNVGDTFPTADPVFRLVSATKKTAKVAIAGGSLSSGAAAITLTKGKKLTLMNTADGTRYELLLVSAP
jgi:hypothetical protein